MASERPKYFGPTRRSIFECVVHIGIGAIAALIVLVAVIHP